MRHTRVVITGCFVIALSASARSGFGQERGGLEAVQALYESAAYDEALATLDDIDSETLQNSSVAQTARQYRALCLIALDRSSDAEQTLEDMVRADPVQPAPDVFPPRLAAMFRRVRERLLPAIALEQYTTAKRSFDRKDYPAAVAGFDRLTALLADPSLNASANTTLGDIRTLANGFQQLARVSVQSPPTPSNTGATNGGGVNGGGTSPESPASTAEIVGAVAVRQQFPPWPSGIARRPGTAYSGVVQVTITPAGDVASIKFIKRVHPVYDRLIETAAKGWKYRSATRNGEPVVFTKLVNVEITDNAGRPPQATVPESVPPVPPAPQPASPAIATPAPNPASDEPAIRALLQAYAGAYSGRNADAVTRLFPGVDERALRQSFSAARSMQVQIRDEQFLSFTSTTATVSCTWDAVFVGQVGTAQRQTQKITLRLQKSGGAWTIVDRR